MPRRVFFGPRGSLRASRVLRGGSWNNNARNLRASNRNDNRNNNIGFRLCRVSPIEKLPTGALDAEPPQG